MLSGSWNKYCEISERGHSSSFQYAQAQWEYSHKFVFRYELTRRTLSSDTIFYDGYRFKISGIVIKGEAFRKYEVVYATRIDSSLNESAPMATDNVKVYEYTGIADEYEFTATELIGAKIIGAFKDGTQYMVIESGSPTNKEVLPNLSNGHMQWSTPFEAGMKAMIQYE